MNNEETCKLFEQLINAYPNDKFFARPKDKVDGSIEVWQEALEDVPLECAMRFLKGHVKKSQYMPAICDVYQFYNQEQLDIQNSFSYKQAKRDKEILENGMLFAKAMHPELFNEKGELIDPVAFWGGEENVPK